MKCGFCKFMKVWEETKGFFYWCPLRFLKVKPSDKGCVHGREKDPNPGGW